MSERWDPFRRLKPTREQSTSQQMVGGKASAGEGREEQRPVPLSFSEQMRREYEAAHMRETSCVAERERRGGD